jgi:hypothetical protein
LNLDRFFDKRENLAGEWRRPHNEEFHNLYTSPNIVRVIKSRRMRWVSHVAHVGKITNMYKILVEIPEIERPLGKHRHKWEDNIRMALVLKL